MKMSEGAALTAQKNACGDCTRRRRYPFAKTFTRTL